MAPPRPLDGLRVLDLSQIVAGPVCTRVLADLGADVIKVEAPTGDLSRNVPPTVEGVGALFAQLNAGKRSACIDIRTAEGGELVAKLAERSDVLVENYRPGALNGRGLGYDDLAARQPRLVYVSISGFGQDGPWATRRGHAPLLHAEAGTMEVASRLRGAEPVPEIHQHADLYSGFFAVSAVCAALYQRDRTGTGQHIDLSLAEALLYASDQVAIDLVGAGPAREFDTWTYPVATLQNGETVCLIGNPLRLFDRWMAALGTAHSGSQPGDETTARIAVERAASAFTDSASLEAELAEHGLMCAVVQPARQLLESEWAARRSVLGLAAPGVRVPAAPWRSSNATIGIAGPAPELGAHTRTVLTEVLGLSDEQLAELTEAHAIA
jgi:crotonobetainyl-CoA:carnitine CoA-transferase CaiB-like acyl-CoA transferase